MPNGTRLASLAFVARAEYLQRFSHAVILKRILNPSMAANT